MVVAIPDLVAFAILLLAFGIVYNLRAFVKGIVGMVHAIVGNIPLIGGLIGSAFDAIANPIVRALDQSVQWLDTAMGTTFHSLAAVTVWTGKTLEGLASGLAILAKHSYAFLSKDYANMLYHRLLKLVQQIQHVTHTVVHKTVVINQAVTKTIGANVLPRLRAVEHAAEVTIPHDIRALRHRTRALEDEYTRLYKWLRTHPWTAVTDAFVGAVAISLTRLGLDWIKCDTNKAVGKALCQNDLGLLADILGLSLAVLAVVDPVAIAKAAIATEEGMATIVDEIATLHG